MTGEDEATLQEVFEYVEDVYRQTRLLIKDAVRELRRETSCHFEHQRNWDYAWRENEHFLDGHYGCVRKALMTFVPEGDLDRGLLLLVNFVHRGRPIVPALMYGAVEPGPSGFDAIDRWASYHTIQHTEEGREGLAANRDGPLTVVTCDLENHFPRSVLARVPLESIGDTEALQRVVTGPLIALLRGDEDEARRLLADVVTIDWPSAGGGADDGEDEELEAV